MSNITNDEVSTNGGGDIMSDDAEKVSANYEQNKKLMEAIENNDVATVEKLIKEGAQI